jgi:acyl-CoA thioesterase II
VAAGRTAVLVDLAPVRRPTEGIDLVSSLKKLVELFQLEQTEEDVYRGISLDLGFRTLFGGQVLGQALMAATRTVASERAAHSMHAYFLRPGDAKAPISYRVRRIRDGRGFSTRHVEAVQENRQIFDLLASFHTHEQGFEHQDPMPDDLLPPESLQSEQERYAARIDEIPEHLRTRLAEERPIEIRHVDPYDKLDPEPRAPIKRLWIRAPGALPDDPALHRAILAYASDFEVLGTAMLPHAVSFVRADVLAASLDHALWIHRPFRIDEWLLYSLQSPAAVAGRGLVRGQVFTRDGLLVASTTQEGLIRRTGGAA